MKIDIKVPNGKRGNVVIEDFEVTESAAKFENMRAIFNSCCRPIDAGKYKRLMIDGHIMMSNTPAEISDHLNFIHMALQRGGNILINGLGLGVCLQAIVEFDNIDRIDVVEISEDVIELVGPTFAKYKNVHIHHADAFDFKAPKGLNYNLVWHDIWQDITADNVPEMTKLHRRYGNRTDWQGSWAKELCRRMVNKTF